MSTYTLSINITSSCKELLDSLMITVETVKGDLSSIDSIELLSPDKSTHLVKSTQSDKPAGMTTSSPTTAQRTLFLDRWMINDSL